MIAPAAGLSVTRQCTLLGIARSSFYYRPRPEAAEELEFLKRLDRIFTGHPVCLSPAADLYRAEVLVRRVLAASPRLPLAHLAKGMLLHARGDPEQDPD